MPPNHSGKEMEPRRPWAALTGFFVLVMAAGCLMTGLSDIIEPPVPLSDASLLAVFPDAARTEKSGNPFFHYKALDPGGRLMGAILLTDSLSPAVKGYLGEIGSVVGITAGGKITLAAVARHRETPYYMGMITSSGLYDEMAGLDLSRPFPEMDTVSGATVSSRAIIEDVREASSRAARSLFGIEVPPPATPLKNPWIDWKTIALFCLLGLSLFAGFTRERKMFRQTVMVLNLAIIGFILNTPLTLSALSRALTLDLPGPSNTLLVLIFLYILISVPLQGRTYCRLVCPFGTLQHLANRVSPWQLSLSPGTLALLPDIRRLVLGLLLFLGVWAGWHGFTEIEPFFSLFSLQLTAIMGIMVIFVLAVSLFIRRFWCNTMCPTGTLLLITSRLVRPGNGKKDETV